MDSRPVPQLATARTIGAADAASCLSLSRTRHTSPGLARRPLPVYSDWQLCGKHIGERYVGCGPAVPVRLIKLRTYGLHRKSIGPASSRTTALENGSLRAAVGQRLLYLENSHWRGDFPADRMTGNGRVPPGRTKGPNDRSRTHCCHSTGNGRLDPQANSGRKKSTPGERPQRDCPTFGIGWVLSGLRIQHSSLPKYYT